MLILALWLLTQDPAAGLTALAEQQWRTRDAAIEATRTAEQIHARQVEIRAKMLHAIGGLPERKTPLNARVTGGFKRDGYRVENIIFESLPDFRVTANLYLPTTGEPPYPAVLGVAGHSDNGKASATYQYAWIGFVKRGYAVLAFDPPGQGERIEYPDESGGSRVGIGVPEHIASGLQCLLTGTTFARYEIWDGVRAFDYLLTRPEIDPRRIAVAGNSGGGTQAAYLAAFEPRLAAVISSCYMTRWRELWNKPGPQDAEQVWPGFISAGLDFDDFALAYAPRPFLMTTAVRDFFPIDGARATYRRITEWFERLGAPQNAGYFEYDDTHGWSKPRREAAARFLDKHFKGLETNGAEPEIETEAESLLYAAKGVLPQGLESTTVRALNRQHWAAIFPKRKAVSLKEPARLRELVRSRLALAAAPPPVVARVENEETVGPLVVRTLSFTAPGQGSFQARWLLPAARTGKLPALVTVGCGQDAAELARTGDRAVLAIDTSGFGDHPPRSTRGDDSPLYQLAARAWLLDRSLTGMAVEDTLAAAAWLRRQEGIDAGRISVMGRGTSAVVALLAGALDSGLRGVAAERMPISYSDFVAADIPRDLTILAIPGVLEDFDLPDAASLLGSRAVWIVDPVRGGGARIIPAQYKAWQVSYPQARFLERPEQRPAAKFYREWLDAVEPHSNR
jgi:cephalosporin-C deacetylase-like acetyl esterase